MNNVAIVVSATSVAAWFYLLLGRGHFWRFIEEDDALIPSQSDPQMDDWPSVVAVVPARDEVGLIAANVGSLLQQDYPARRFVVVLVDDRSTDGTAAVAREAAMQVGSTERLTIIRGIDPPSSWTGKLWAMAQGFAYVEGQSKSPDFVLFSDADIAYDVNVVRQLVQAACARKTVLTSLMVKLRCESLAERMLIPAFVFFFRKLYPFAWVNSPACRTAAAAGGCMLVRPDALRRAGGFRAIRSALIDDCALGSLLKGQGAIWLGLTENARSLRASPTVEDIRLTVARSAYAQLRYSPLALFGTVLAMGVVYIAPPLTAVLASGVACGLGLVAWGMMAFAFAPALRFYKVKAIWALALPAIASMYLLFTLDSALQHWRGRGGAWKGRFQAPASRGMTER
ncbi:glycosyltransferase [Microvirga sp. 2MCAF38]|uniref:glycosyltransferase n=1 Tax=Microvirga sp. 2MCAF38 TaxID=3232989 RepID=UPI003F97ED91